MAEDACACRFAKMAIFIELCNSFNSMLTWISGHTAPGPHGSPTHVCVRVRTITTAMTPSPVFRQLRDLLFDCASVLVPPRCLLCGRPLTAAEEGLCLDCYLRMPRTGLHRRPSSRVSDRLARLLPQCRVASWFYYRRGGEYASLIHEAKYRDAPYLAEGLGRMFAQEIKPEGFFDDVDVLVPMPVHWTRRLTRGYNQTEYIARGVSEATGLNVSKTLRAVKRHGSQTRLGRRLRMSNMSPDFFGVRHPERLAGKHVLLIDDVITTGSTVEAAVTALLRDARDIRAISVLSLAITEND